MSLLQAELDRLYGTVDVPSQAGLAGKDRPVRALVMEVGKPADWKAMAPLWQGVQADLGLPAPAIVVNGCDAYQLWFSLAVAAPAERALAFLRGLQRRYLADIQPERLMLYPAPSGNDAAAWQQAAPVPALQAVTERWSAFVSPDLASIFSDDPWLDREPNPEAQASVLARLKSIEVSAWEAAVKVLVADYAVEQVNTPTITVPLPVAPLPGVSLQSTSPRSFLMQVMNDTTVAMNLRIDAAKALLKHDPE